jgi:DNA-directed RNA polymerase specialized sigma24 family protein
LTDRQTASETCSGRRKDQIALFESRERAPMTLRFIEEREYHEIAAAHAVQIETVQ